MLFVFEYADDTEHLLSLPLRPSSEGQLVGGVINVRVHFHIDRLNLVREAEIERVFKRHTRRLETPLGTLAEKWSWLVEHNKVADVKRIGQEEIAPTDRLSHYLGRLRSGEDDEQMLSLFQAKIERSDSWEIREFVDAGGLNVLLGALAHTEYPKLLFRPLKDVLERSRRFVYDIGHADPTPLLTLYTRLPARYQQELLNLLAPLCLVLSEGPEPYPFISNLAAILTSRTLVPVVEMLVQDVEVAEDAALAAAALRFLTAVLISLPDLPARLALRRTFSKAGLDHTALVVLPPSLLRLH